MSKRKPYKPRPIRANAYLGAVQAFKPLTQADKEYLFKQAIKSINAMQFGINLTTSDFTCICDLVNISLLLTEIEIGRDYLEGLYEAREAMQQAKQRYIKTSKLGFTATELKAVKVALTIHQQQIEICTLGEFTQAFDEQEKRIKQGNFYKRAGDLKVSERIAV